MEMEILQLAQGSPEWHEFRRNPANHPASYAAVVGIVAWRTFGNTVVGKINAGNGQISGLGGA